MSRKTFRMLSAGAIQFTLRKFCFWQCIVNNRKFKMERRRESKKCNSLTRQNNNFARASLFFVHSFPSLHDYHVKMPNFTFCGGRKQAMTKFSFSLWSCNWIWLIETTAPEEFACIWHLTIESEKMWIHFSCDVFVAVGCRGILTSLIFTKAWSTQAWIAVVSSSLYFWKSVFSFRVDYFEMESLFQTESFLTACISLVHEPDKLW